MRPPYLVNRVPAEHTRLKSAYGNLKKVTKYCHICQSSKSV